MITRNAGSDAITLGSSPRLDCMARCHCNDLNISPQVQGAEAASVLVEAVVRMERSNRKLCVSGID
jgi:hypothetical protein